VSVDLIARRWTILLMFGIALGSACSSKWRPATEGANSSDQIIASTPPFQTKEPEHYQAVRTITFTDSSGRSFVTKTVIARYEELRREEMESGSHELVLLDSDQGRVILLPQAGIYSEADSGTSNGVIPDQQSLEMSPDRLLHSEPNSTSYQKLGPESVLGRQATKYRVVVNISAGDNVTRSETMIWVDEGLGMPIRSETKVSDGSSTLMEISNVIMQVDKRLFQIPAGYEKVTTVELRRRLGKN
jgi:outer membrane lipoprotein-sorting protein